MSGWRDRGLWKATGGNGDGGGERDGLGKQGAPLLPFSLVLALKKREEGLPYVEGKGGHNVGLGGSCRNGRGGRSMCK